MGRIYFDDKDMPKEQKSEYVLWIDIMGTRNRMSTSVRTSTMFICRLHACILDHKTSGLHVYPMMDGAYVTSKSADEMEKFIISAFNDIYDTFVAESDDLHRFIVKGALAYGPIVHGSEIPETCSAIFTKNTGYLQGVLFGVPMIQANKGEKLAPPFGVYCDESARMASNKFSFVWYKWLKDNEKKKDMLKQLDKYFEYASKHTYELEYPKEKISEHEEKAKQYFGS